jgi:hypothetical protein
MMRVSEKRAIAGQKGGIGSALARMKLENASRSRRVRSQANAGHMISPAAASADHSHSHQSLLKAEVIKSEPDAADPAKPSQGREAKPSITVSTELAAYVARRSA